MVEEKIVRLLCDLVAIESVNPAYLGGTRGEAAIADYVEEYCRRLGLDVARQAVLPGRDNVVAELRVPGASGTILFEAHLDTVALEPMGERALRPEVRGGNVYGRGACDTKGSLAAMLVALDQLRAEARDLRVNVVLLAAVDEEYRYRGVLRFLEDHRPVQAAIVGEPTDLQIVVAHKGCVRLRISTLGRAAHSSRPEDGENAIDHMAEVLLGLRRLHRQLRQRSHPLVGSPTLSVGRIWGGTGGNIVPDRCTIEIDRRTIPGEEHQAIIAEFDASLAEVAAAHPTIRFEREEPYLADWALDTPLDAPVVVAVRRACQELELDDSAVGVAYGTDASKLWALGRVPSVVLGPGSIAQAHTGDEHVPIAQLVTASALYHRSVRQFGALVD